MCLSAYLSSLDRSYDTVGQSAHTTTNAILQGGSMHRCKQVAQLSQRDRAAGWASNSGVATEWTGMDMSTPPPFARVHSWDRCKSDDFTGASGEGEG